MLAVEGSSHPNVPLMDTLMRTLSTLCLSALLLLFLPLTLIAAVADCLWFRLRSALRGPQRPKGVWEF